MYQSDSSEYLFLHYFRMHAHMNAYIQTHLYLVCYLLALGGNVLYVYGKFCVQVNMMAVIAGRSVII